MKFRGHLPPAAHGSHDLLGDMTRNVRLGRLSWGPRTREDPRFGQKLSRGISDSFRTLQKIEFAALQRMAGKCFHRT